MIGALMMLTVSSETALLFLGFIVVLQKLESNLIYPRVVGNAIRLPILWVLTAVTLVGGVGMLIVVPLMATVHQLILILGLVLLIWQGFNIQIACRGIGVLLLVYGMIQIIAYLRNKYKNLAAHSIFTVSIVTWIFGAWVAFRPETVISTLPIIVGIMIALHGIQNMVQTLALERQEYQHWWAAIIIGLITVIFV